MGIGRSQMELTSTSEQQVLLEQRQFADAKMIYPGGRTSCDSQ
jgi:hypothetical protein